MDSELKELQRKKTELENELQSLSKKEEILGETTGILEERLAAKSEERIKPRPEVLSEFADAQVNLETLIERFNKSEGYSKGRGEVQDQQGAQRQDVVVVMEQTVPLEVGLRFENRVRLRENVVFSWSYQKLS